MTLIFDALLEKSFVIFIKKTTINESIFTANGKLLISGEYFVLDGALALALPTQKGQRLIVKTIDQQIPQLIWESRDADGSIWFEGRFHLGDFTIIFTTVPTIAERLQSILQATRQLNPAFLSSGEPKNIQVASQLDFPRNWGLGSSSTLIHCLANWGQVDPYALLKATFGGSGYDLACAAADGPILYQREVGIPQATPCAFDPVFQDHLYFVYLGKKQNSREGIARYRQRVALQPELIEQITVLTKTMLHAKDLAQFEVAIQAHETLIAEQLQLSKVKDLYFSDYWGPVKSLGAWGGDFVLVSSRKSEAETQTYFLEKGFDTFVPYRKMILNKNNL